MAIQKFSSINESKLLPHYTKGEVFVFSSVRDIDISIFASELGYKQKPYDVDFYGPDMFLIECPIGKEIQCGKDFVENYPEFFTGYERRNIRDEQIYQKLEDVIRIITDIRDEVGTKFMDIDNNIESAIEILKSITK